MLVLGGWRFLSPVGSRVAGGTRGSRWQRRGRTRQPPRPHPAKVDHAVSPRVTSPYDQPPLSLSPVHTEEKDPIRVP